MLHKIVIGARIALFVVIVTLITFMYADDAEFISYPEDED